MVISARGRLAQNPIILKKDAEARPPIHGKPPGCAARARSATNGLWNWSFCRQEFDLRRFAVRPSLMFMSLVMAGVLGSGCPPTIPDPDCTPCDGLCTPLKATYLQGFTGSVTTVTVNADGTVTVEPDPLFIDLQPVSGPLSAARQTRILELLGDWCSYRVTEGPGPCFDCGGGSVEFNGRKLSFGGADTPSAGLSELYREIEEAGREAAPDIIF
jgi:hypothetical protein